MTDIYPGKLSVVTAAVNMPVTLPEVRRHLRNPPEEDNDFIRSLIRASTRRAAHYQGRDYMTTVYNYYFDDFPVNRRIELPRPPLQSVASVKYQDADDAQQTFSSSSYQVVTYTDEAGFIEVGSTSSWPMVYDKADAVAIQFTSGYSAIHLVPETAKAAIKLFVEAQYDRPPAAEFKKLIDAAENLLNLELQAVA